MSLRELSDRWWEHSDDFRREPYWLGAHAQLKATDQRLLLVGPGSRNELHLVSQALIDFLGKVGFAASMLDSDFAPTQHRDQAKDFPRILALPVTVGSTTEVIDFVKDEGLEKLIAVVLPAEHRDGYFARILEHDHRIQITTCGKIAIDPAVVDPLLGKMCLMALGSRLRRSRTLPEAARRTQEEVAPSSVQAREARVAERREVSPSGGLATVFVGLAVGGMGVVTLLALVGSFTNFVVGAVVVVLLFTLSGFFIMRSMGFISEGGLLQIAQEVIHKTPEVLRLGIGRGQPELPGDEQGDAQSDTAGDDDPQLGPGDDQANRA